MNGDFVRAQKISRANRIFGQPPVDALGAIAQVFSFYRFRLDKRVRLVATQEVAAHALAADIVAGYLEPHLAAPMLLNYPQRILPSAPSDLWWHVDAARCFK